MAGLNLPTNTFYNSNCKRDKKLEVLLREDFIKAYDEWIQQNDFNIKQLSYELQALGYAPGTVMQEIKRELLNRKIWKRDGKFGCICGFRTDNRGILLNHVRSCETAKQCKVELTEKYFTPEKLRDALDTGKFEVARDYFDWICEQEGYTSMTEQNFVYTLGYDYIKEYNKKGLIKYSTDSERARKAMGHRASETLQEKYGVKNASQLDWVKQKKVETFRKHWGTDHYLKTRQGKEHLRQSVRDKYGVDNISQLDWVKQKKAQTFQENWGVDNIFQRRDIVQQAWKDKLGVDNPIRNMEIRRRALKTVLKDGYLFKNKDEDFVRNVIVELFKQYNIEVRDTVTTNEQENRNHYVDEKANRIYVPDIQILLTNGTKVIVDVHDDTHVHPSSKVSSPTSKESLMRDLRRAVYFSELNKVKYFILWWQNKWTTEEKFNRVCDFVENVILPCLSDNRRYLDYFRTQIWGNLPIRYKICCA